MKHIQQLKLKERREHLKSKMREYPWVTRTVIGVLIIVLIWSGYSWFLKKRAEIEMSLVRPVPVMAIPVEQRTMPVIAQSFGDLRAYASADLSAQTSGDIAEINFNGGDIVKEGAVLVMIENASEEANLQKAQADKELKQIDFTRTTNLVQRGAQPQQMLDIAKAELAVSTAETLAAQDALNKTYISAPFDGRLGARLVSVGQYVSPGQAIVEIVDLGRLKIQFSVPERYLSQLQVGQKAEITTDAYPGRTFYGEVDYVSPSIDPVTRTIGVEALIENTDKLLSPGLSVRVSQVLAEDNQALIVPEEALVYSLEGASVYIAEDDPDFELDERVRDAILEQQSAQRKIPVEELPPLQIKKVKRVNVQTGTFVDGIAQITKGVTANQLVITQGQQKLRDGAIVMIVDPAQRMAEEAQAAGAQ